MSDRKPGGSVCGYCREVYSPRAPRVDVLEVIESQEQTVRRLTNERWWRRMQALMPSAEAVEVEDFGTQVTL